jgi:hypothetical protein
VPDPASGALGDETRRRMREAALKRKPMSEATKADQREFSLPQRAARGTAPIT